jgi:hypothetical protein
MQQFLIKTILFIILVISITTGIYLLSDFSLKQRKQNLLKIGDDINIIFAGDSNVEGAVNDSLISNSMNIAQSGEAYLYTYVKLRNLLEYNSQISTIYLGFSFQDLLKSTEERWLFQDQFVIEKIKYYNYLLGNPEKTMIIKHNLISFLRGSVESILNNFMVLLKSYSSEGLNRKIINFGGYEYIEKYKLQEDIKLNSFSEHRFEKGSIQEMYLKMISQLCRQKSIRLVLFDTPKHKYFATRFDKETKNYWLSLHKSLPQDSLLDLSMFILPDSCFYDMDHLNCKGAVIFSRYLNEKLHREQNDTLIKGSRIIKLQISGR